MISCIISSKDQRYIPEITANVADTIGVPHEIIVIDSTTCTRGIAEAYNRGASKAQYGILCFMHKDILFRTANWGINVIEHFKDASLGMIGVAGSTYKTKSLSSWWQPRLEDYEPKRMSITHCFPDLPAERIVINPRNEKISKVISLDGVLLIMPKNVWQEIPFDEHTLSSFHCYDLDSGLSLFGKYHVGVVYDIGLDHFSPGFPDTAYYKDLIAVHLKHQHKLPLKLEPLDEHAFYRNEMAAYRIMFGVLKKMQVPASLRRKYFYSTASYFLLSLKQSRFLFNAIIRALRK